MSQEVHPRMKKLRNGILNFKNKLQLDTLVMQMRRIQGGLGKHVRIFMDNLRISFWNFRIKLPKLELLAPQFGAIILLALGIGVAVVGFRIHHSNMPITLAVLVPDFYANVSTTLIGIALTVFIIDALNRRRDDRLEKIRLIRDIGCGDHGIALRAIVEITDKNLHWKGFLRNRHFIYARLAGAQLMSADLSYSSFHFADFTGAVLFGAILRRTCFWHADMRGVDFRDADLTETDFIFADLTDAIVTKEQIQLADRLLGARLPNGEIYDGRFNRPGDIRDAKIFRVDVNDPVALAKWYAMSYNEFMRAGDLHKNRPEFTDWGNK